jgi:hypothetical protein
MQTEDSRLVDLKIVQKQNQKESFQSHESFTSKLQRLTNYFRLLINFIVVYSLPESISYLIGRRRLCVFTPPVSWSSDSSV